MVTGWGGKQNEPHLVGNMPFFCQTEELAQNLDVSLYLKVNQTKKGSCLILPLFQRYWYSTMLHSIQKYVLYICARPLSVLLRSTLIIKL